jgi:hypothetical protein
MEILGFQVKRVHIRQDGVHGSRDAVGRRRFKVGRGSQGPFLD